MQDEFGLYGLLSGHITSTWKAIQHGSYLRDSSTQRNSNLIKKNLVFTFTLWKARSTLVHDILKKRRLNQELVEVNNEILDKNKQWKILIRATDSNLFDTRVSELIKFHYKLFEKKPSNVLKKINSLSDD